jgi:hypothetical protein
MKHKLSGEQLTAYLEAQGVKLADFERWRSALEDGVTGSRSAANRIRQLERELARKEKALAEAAALLVLKKECRACIQTRTTTPKGRARVSPGSSHRGAVGWSSISAGLPVRGALRSDHRALASLP